MYSIYGDKPKKKDIADATKVVAVNRDCSQEKLDFYTKKKMDNRVNKTAKFVPRRTKKSRKEDVISSVSHFFANSQGPNFRHFPTGHPMLCAVTSSCIYFPWYIRERKKQGKVTIHPSWPWRP